MSEQEGDSYDFALVGMFDAAEAERGTAPSTYFAAMRARLDQAEATLSKMRQIVPDVGECDDWCERCGKYVVGVFPGGHVGGVCPICDRSTNTYLDPIRDILYTKEHAMAEGEA